MMESAEQRPHFTHTGKGGKRMARRPRNRSAVHISTGSYVCEKA